MNVNCLICSDLFAPTSNIFGTKCGHVFHYSCLIQWMERSKTCPHCRSYISIQNIFRIYFNVLTAEDIREEKIEKLSDENKSLKLQLSTLKVKYFKYKSGLQQIQRENNILKTRLKLYAVRASHKSGSKRTKSSTASSKKFKKQVDPVENIMIF